MVLLQLGQGLEYHANDDVDDDYHERGTDNHTLLKGVVLEPVLAVIIAFAKLEAEESLRILGESVQAEAVHQTDTLLRGEAVVINSLLFSNPLWAVNLGIVLSLELITLDLEVNDSQHSSDDKENGNDPNDALPNASRLLAVPDVGKVDLIWQVGCLDLEPFLTRFLLDNVLEVELSELPVLLTQAAAAAPLADIEEVPVTLRDVKCVLSSIIAAHLSESHVGILVGGLISLVVCLLSFLLLLNCSELIQGLLVICLCFVFLLF